MKNLDIKFLTLAALALVIGVSMGVYMGIVHDFQLSPVHAHLNLLGWASLALFGIVYRLYPEMAESRMAALHFMLAAPAAFLLPLGIAYAILAQQPLLAIAASFMWLGGAILFLIQLLAKAFGPAAKAVPAAA